MSPLAHRKQVRSEEVAEKSSPGSSSINRKRPFTERKSVAIFGSGIAGLSAAHEAMEMGFDVTVYEALDCPGGMARSGRTPEGMPTEYSWRGFGPWYHNAFDMMRRVPSANDAKKSIYDIELSRQVLFTILPDNIVLPWPEDKPPLCITTFTRYDYLAFLLICIRTICADRRSEEVYSKINAADYFRARMTPQASKSVVGTFGPWIGTDSRKTSLHHAAQFHMKNAWPSSNGPQVHAADRYGPEWRHKGREGWLMLRGPSNEVWFDPWVAFLKEKGVKFQFATELVNVQGKDDKVTAATMRRVGHSEVFSVVADTYIVACSPFACRKIFQASSPNIRADLQISKFPGLVQDGQHIQISFRIGFAERILTNKKTYAFILSDSEYNLTMLPDDLIFHHDISLGEGVKSLWTGTACVSYVPGQKTGFSAEHVTREGFMQEVLHQMYRSQSLDKMIRESNGGRSLSSFEIARTEVWHSWIFPTESDGVTKVDAPQPKWVTSTNTQAFLPTAKTSISNLILAGSHTRTGADLWSMEGAAESGKRAAFLLKESSVGRTVIPQYKPVLLRCMCLVDNVLYSVNLPNIIDVILAVFLVCATLGVIQLGLGSVPLELLPPLALAVGILLAGHEKQ